MVYFPKPRQNISLQYFIPKKPLSSPSERKVRNGFKREHSLEVSLVSLSLSLFPPTSSLILLLSSPFSNRQRNDLCLCFRSCNSCPWQRRKASRLHPGSSCHRSAYNTAGQPDPPFFISDSISSSMIPLFSPLCSVMRSFLLPSLSKQSLPLATIPLES